MTQIAIKYVNPAKEGKKYGSIKDAAGNTYWVPKEMIAGFTAGSTVDVPLSQQTWGSNVVQVVSGHANPAPVASPNPGGATTIDERKEATIFVTGIVGRAIGSGKFDTQDIPLLAKAALAAWNEVKSSL